jgi:hypothetical protein
MRHAQQIIIIIIQISNKQTKCFWVGWMEEHPRCHIAHYALDEE